MEKVDLKKALIVGGSALAVSVAGYLAYKFIFGRSAEVDISKLTPEELIHHNLLKDIRSMGSVQLNG